MWLEGKILRGRILFMYFVKEIQDINKDKDNKFKI